jgi:hypothetical protein
MRQLFTVRFLATLGALAGLALLLYAFVLGGDDPVAEVAQAGPTTRRIDLVSQVFSVSAQDFDMVAGRSVGTLDLVLDAQRTVHVVPGTYGQVTCETLDAPGSCAVVADLLGDAVVWFALVPLLPSGDVEMSPIVSLDSDLATLDDGWQVPYAPRLRRTCSRDFPSFRVFREELGTDFTSIYDLVEQRLTEVVCAEA